MKFWDNDILSWLVPVLLAAAVVLTGIGVLFATAERNADLTEQLAKACIANGGTWTSGPYGGCYR